MTCQTLSCFSSLWLNESIIPETPSFSKGMRSERKHESLGSCCLADAAEGEGSCREVRNREAAGVLLVL
jgi:hypothetical protein